jgi:hypothetical protein
MQSLMILWKGLICFMKLFEDLKVAINELLDELLKFLGIEED